MCPPRCEVSFDLPGNGRLNVCNFAPRSLELHSLILGFNKNGFAFDVASVLCGSVGVLSMSGPLGLNFLEARVLLRMIR